MADRSGTPVNWEDGLLTRGDAAEDCTPADGVADSGTVEYPVCGEPVVSMVVVGLNETCVQPCGHRVRPRFTDKFGGVEGGGQ